MHSTFVSFYLDKEMLFIYLVRIKNKCILIKNNTKISDGLFKNKILKSLKKILNLIICTSVY